MTADRMTRTLSTTTAVTRMQVTGGFQVSPGTEGTVAMRTFTVRQTRRCGDRRGAGQQVSRSGHRSPLNNYLTSRLDYAEADATTTAKAPSPARAAQIRACRLPNLRA